MSAGKNGGRRRAFPALPGLSVADGFMQHPFDAAFGIQTSGLVAGRHLKIGHRHDRHATAYYGVAPSVMLALIERWRRIGVPAPLAQTTFIDMGAGMGRAVLLASEMRFRRVIGVELHPHLAGIARRNVARWRALGRARTSIQIRCCDATEFSFPPGPCVVFLFNPFGAAVMRRMLAGMAKGFAGRPGELDLLYINNEQEGELERRRDFQRLFLGKVRRSREDAHADRAILTNQPDGEYAAHPYEDCSIWRWTDMG